VGVNEPLGGNKKREVGGCRTQKLSNKHKKGGLRQDHQLKEEKKVASERNNNNGRKRKGEPGAKG